LQSFELLETLFRFAVPIIYLILSLCYFSLPSGRSSLSRRFFHFFQIIAWGLFFLLLVFRGGTQARCPLGNVFEAALFANWLLAGLYFLVELFARTRLFGLIIMPFVTLGTGISCLGLDRVQPLPDHLASLLFPLHVAITMLGYAFLFLALVTAGIYWKHYRDLKEKKLGFLFHRLPPLDRLAKALSGSLLVGWLCLVIGVGLGILWSYQAGSELNTLLAKMLMTFVTITWYSFTLLGILLKMDTRRICLFSLIGFLLLLLGLFTGEHGF